MTSTTVLPTMGCVTCYQAVIVVELEEKAMDVFSTPGATGFQKVQAVRALQLEVGRLNRLFEARDSARWN